MFILSMYIFPLIQKSKKKKIKKKKWIHFILSPIVLYYSMSSTADFDFDSVDKDEILEVLTFLIKVTSEVRIFQFEGICQNFTYCSVIYIMIWFLCKFYNIKDKKTNTSQTVGLPKAKFLGVFLTVLLLASGIYESWNTLNESKTYGKNFYEILELKKYEANKETIKRQFRNISKKYHPDKGNNDDLFIELTKAKDTLIDEDLKYCYDTYGVIGSIDYKEFVETDDNGINSKSKTKEMLQAKRELSKYIAVGIKLVFFVSYHFAITLCPFLLSPNELLLKWYEVQTNEMLEWNNGKKKHRNITKNLSLVTAVMEVNPAIVWHVSLSTIYFFFTLTIYILGLGYAEYLFPFNPEFEILLICHIMFVSFAMAFQILFHPRLLNLYSHFKSKKILEEISATSKEKTKFTIVDVLLGLKVNAYLGYFLSLLNLLKMIFETICYSIKFYSQILTSAIWITIIRMVLDGFYGQNKMALSALVFEVWKRNKNQLQDFFHAVWHRQESSFTLDTLDISDDEYFRFLCVCYLLGTNFAIRIVLGLPAFPLLSYLRAKVTSTITNSPVQETTKTTTTTTTTTATTDMKKKMNKASTPKAANAKKNKQT